MTLVVINGYNAYADVAEADTYLAIDPVLADAWNAMTDTAKGMRLAYATRFLDGFRWRGMKKVLSQATEWPREGMDVNGVAFDGLPSGIMNGAIIIAASPDVVRQTVLPEVVDEHRVKRVKTEQSELEFWHDVSQSTREVVHPIAEISKIAYVLVAPYLDLVVTGTGVVAPVEGGGDNPELFDREQFESIGANTRGVIG